MNNCKHTNRSFLLYHSEYWQFKWVKSLQLSNLSPLSFTIWAKFPVSVLPFFLSSWNYCLLISMQQHVLSHLFLKSVHWADKKKLGEAGEGGRRRRAAGMQLDKSLQVCTSSVLQVSTKTTIMQILIFYPSSVYLLSPRWSLEEDVLSLL